MYFNFDLPYGGINWFKSLKSEMVVYTHKDMIKLVDYISWPNKTLINKCEKYEIYEIDIY